MKLRAKDTTVQESAVRITRNAPRRRKWEPDEEIAGIETAPPALKRTKIQENAVTETTLHIVKEDLELEGIHATVNGGSKKQTQKSKQVGRKQVVTATVHDVGAQDTKQEAEEEVLNYNNDRTPTESRKAKQPSTKVRRTKKEQTDAGEEEEREVDGDSPKKRKRKAKDIAKIKEVKEQDTDIEDEAKVLNGDTPQKPKRKRKTKEEKEAEAMPLAARTAGLRMYIGAHVSIAKGLQNSVTNCQHVGGNAFALFLKSQRKWENPPLTDESTEAFRSHCQTYKYDASSHILPHGSYLVNLAQEDPERAAQAYSAFIDDLHRCERLGIKLYNFHPGASSSSPLPDAIKRIANQLNTALASTKTVIPLLENMAGSGTVIGSRFSDLRDIISHIKPEFKSRIGVCIDTCHAFAAGHDLRSPESFKQVLKDFDEVVGIQYLKALHLNDSKAPLGSKKDLHQNIGLGFLGLRAFHNVMNEPRFENLPLILETPCEKPDPDDPTGKKTVEDKGIWAREIKLLEGLIGMDLDGEEFGRLEKELSEKGREEREKMLKSIEAREEKARKKLEKGQKTLVDMMTGVGKGRGQGKAKRKREKEKVEHESSGEESEADLD
ncbi:hypothetical protein EPUS_08216 [Endocarpon pusillum Z07020]|uniref:Apurinic-apyrimidinic endonuclease 1 n=1 Tax=Endocarpon pusillum (strain Z07020 / HMAS-L-300199) TaxID=1263415 RepID=U1HDS0_ENDPU|nr:uncharacterized protein EPUS_08216 [Endocarpon pusillum Z07020]ERF68150.1 hypothetical protein EPUS_08216 [Endocarpon pusillum Z07020]